MALWLRKDEKDEEGVAFMDAADEKTPPHQATKVHAREEGGQILRGRAQNYILRACPRLLEAPSAQRSLVPLCLLFQLFDPLPESANVSLPRVDGPAEMAAASGRGGTAVADDTLLIEDLPGRGGRGAVMRPAGAGEVMRPVGAGEVMRAGEGGGKRCGEG